MDRKIVTKNGWLKKFWKDRRKHVICMTLELSWWVCWAGKRTCWVVSKIQVRQGSSKSHSQTTLYCRATHQNHLICDHPPIKREESTCSQKCIMQL